jgi:hypothetical protein
MTLAQVFFLIRASAPDAEPGSGEDGTIDDLLAMQAAAARGGWSG